MNILVVFSLKTKITIKHQWYNCKNKINFLLNLKLLLIIQIILKHVTTCQRIWKQVFNQKYVLVK